MIKILFICHGNICRSPMAEFVFNDMIKKHGLEDDIIAFSAATSREEIGNDIHYGTKRMLDKHGIQYSRRRARQITVDDYREYDYIICMDDMNVLNTLRIVGDDRQRKIYKMMDFAEVNTDHISRQAGRNVADPWYTGDFERTWEDIISGLTGLLEYICVKIGRKLL